MNMTIDRVPKLMASSDILRHFHSHVIFRACRQQFRQVVAVGDEKSMHPFELTESGEYGLREGRYVNQTCICNITQPASEFVQKTVPQQTCTSLRTLRYAYSSVRLFVRPIKIKVKYVRILSAGSSAGTTAVTQLTSAAGTNTTQAEIHLSFTCVQRHGSQSWEIPAHATIHLG